MQGCEEKEIEPPPRALPALWSHPHFPPSPGGTVPNVAHSGSCGGAGSANDKPQRGGTLISPRVPPRWGSASLHASPQLPLWATFGVVPSGLSRTERRQFDVCRRMQRSASVEVFMRWLWPCRRSTRFHSKTRCGNEQERKHLNRKCSNRKSRIESEISNSRIPVSNLQYNTHTG